MIGGMHKNAEIKDSSVTLKASRCRRGLKSNGPCGVSTRVWLLGWDVGRRCMLSAFTPEGRRDGSLVLSQSDTFTSELGQDEDLRDWIEEVLSWLMRSS